jgi:hypothetical protein
VEDGLRSTAEAKTSRPPDLQEENLLTEKDFQPEEEEQDMWSKPWIWDDYDGLDDDDADVWGGGESRWRNHTEEVPTKGSGMKKITQKRSPLLEPNEGTL